MLRPHDLDVLIGRAQDGDVRAFEQLVSTHLGLVRRYARAFVDQEHDADDLAQEALLKAYRSLRQFRYQSSFGTWLYTVFRSVFLDSMRSRAGRERSLTVDLERRDDGEGEHAPAADELLAREQERRRVWRAIREVPVEFRTALVLFDIEGCSYDEVAAIEGVAVGTVKSRLSRGRAHLARLLRMDVGEGRGARVASEPRTGSGTWRGSPSSQGEGGGT